MLFGRNKGELLKRNPLKFEACLCGHADRQRLAIAKLKGNIILCGTKKDSNSFNLHSLPHFLGRPRCLIPSLLPTKREGAFCPEIKRQSNGQAMKL